MEENHVTDMKKNKLYSPHLREESLQETVYQVKEGLISKRGEGGIGAVKREEGKKRSFFPSMVPVLVASSQGESGGFVLAHSDQDRGSTMSVARPLPSETRSRQVEN